MRITFCFFCYTTSTSEIYTLSLHDALPICRPHAGAQALLMTVVDIDTHVYEPTDIWEKYLERDYRVVARSAFWHEVDRSEEHTSELQSLRHLVCRLLLETETGAPAAPTTSQ